jgi:hypothetical protein
MKVNWFDRGRDAMTEGRPCLIRDARISNQDRQAWYAGWNHQARLNTAKTIPPGDRADAIAGLQQILDQLNSQP